MPILALSLLIGIRPSPYLDCLRQSLGRCIVNIMSVASHSFHIGHLIAEYCLHAGIRFWALGSRTLHLFEQAGLEPDQQFSLHEKGDLPALAVEVAITSGGLNKLAVYQRFQIPEIWVWQGDELHVYRFDPATGRYATASSSTALPCIDLVSVARCARIEESSEAIREFRKSLS